MGQLSKYPASNVAFNSVVNGPALGLGSDSTVCLAETWSKRLATVNKFEIPDLPWLTAEEGMAKLREIGTLTNLSFKTYSPTLEVPEDTSFTMTWRSRLGRGAPTSLKSSVMAFLCRPGPARTDPMELGNLHAIGIIGSWGDGDGVAAFNGQRQGGYGCYNGQQR